MLGARLAYLFFSVVAAEVVLERWVRDEDWAVTVKVLPLLPLLLNVAEGRVDVRGTGEVGSYIKGKGAKATNVDPTALHEVLVQVLGSRTPDEQHLGLRLQRLELGQRARLRRSVLARVAAGILEDVVND